MRPSVKRFARRLLVGAILLIATPLRAGPYSVEDVTRNAFGHPFPSLSREETREFFVGNSFFRQAWVRAPATTTLRDGLGPTFNATSCSACHQLDGRGLGSAKTGFAHVSLLFRLEDAPDYGGQLNPVAIDDVPGEGRALIAHALIPGQFADGSAYELRRPVVSFQDWLFGSPPSHARVSARVGTQLIGLGLLERIPAGEILKREDVDDRDDDGISGRAAIVLDMRTGLMTLGRFGWKAEQPTLEQQNAAALIGDMGLTSELFPVQNCTKPQLACQAAISGGDPEVDARVLSRLTHYTRTIAVPARRNAASPEVLEGERIFARIGCADCHTPSYEIEGNKISPFTDMLLHDMGPALADESIAGLPLATEWRTPPLWGIGLFQTVNGHTNLLHDGRARGVSEAILWHGGEGERAREAYRDLSHSERANLIKFVESL